MSVPFIYDSPTWLKKSAWKTLHKAGNCVEHGSSNSYFMGILSNTEFSEKMVTKCLTQISK